MLLTALRQLFLTLCLLGSLATVAGVALCLRPVWSEEATRLLVHRLTDRPVQLVAQMEAEEKRSDLAAAARTAQRFIDSIPRPIPADAFGERYRKALQVLMAAGTAKGDLPLQLHAGELAFTFDHNDSKLLFAYGKALAANRQDDKAAEILESAFRIRPNSPQVLHALEALLRTTNPAKVEALRQRQQEALALTMVLPSWMSGNLVAANGAKTQAIDLHLSVERAVTATLSCDFVPTNLYVVLPRVRELEVKLSDARWLGADGSSVPLNFVPQGNLQSLPDGFARITVQDDEDFDAPAILAVPLGSVPSSAGTVSLRFETRPSPAIAPAFQALARRGAAARPPSAPPQ